MMIRVLGGALCAAMLISGCGKEKDSGKEDANVSEEETGTGSEDTGKEGDGKQCA